MTRFDYGHPVDPITFLIHWTDDQGAEISTEEIRRRDLSDAITAACNLLKRCKGGARDANGFYVKRN